jgi:predicted nucleic-acid-binding protein
MRAVDTNVLVRLVTRDDRRQVAAAESFVNKGAWVSTLVLMEATGF